DFARGVVQLVPRGRRCVVVAIADESELPELGVEGEALVVALTGEQRAARSVTDSTDEGAVVRGRFRRHSVNDVGAVLRDHVVRDFRNRRLCARGEVADDQVGARIFLLLSLARDTFLVLILRLSPGPAKAGPYRRTIARAPLRRRRQN